MDRRPCRGRARQGYGFRTRRGPGCRRHADGGPAAPL